MKLFSVWHAILERGDCAALLGFKKMAPSEIGPLGSMRGVAGEHEPDMTRTCIFHEGDQRRDNASFSHGQGHPAQQKKQSWHDRFGRNANRKAAFLRDRRSVCGLDARQRDAAFAHGVRPAVPSRVAKPAKLYAALDLGTNNCRLLIAAPTRPGHFRVTDAFSRIVRLGEGVAHTGRLSRAAMNRAIEALKICRSKLAQADITHQWLIATEACRMADNGAEFIDRVRREAGLELEIVDRKTEARLAVSGCGTLVDRKTEAIVLFDIGGGSSEIALIDISKRRSPRLAEHIIAWTSLPVGVVTLAEHFGGAVVTQDDFTRMKDYVCRMLEKFSGRHKLDHLCGSPNFHLLGTSGTVTTLAGIYLNLERYDRRRVDGMWLKSADVTRMTKVLLSWDMSQRVANPCIGADRADLVLAGCAILEAIRSVWPDSRLRVADRGLREGILTELMSSTGAWRRRNSASSGRCRSGGAG